MSIKADDITRIIREQLGSFSLDVDVAEVGAGVSVGDGSARVRGVGEAMSGARLEALVPGLRVDRNEPDHALCGVGPGKLPQRWSTNRRRGCEDLF